MTALEHSVAVLVFDGVKLLDVGGPAEVLAEAAQMQAGYQLQYVSPTGDPVITSAGVRLAVDASAASLSSVGTVLVAGGDRLPVQPIEPELLVAVRHLVDAADRVASVCTGAFLLAAIGALDHRRATTHWAHTRLLARAYPSVQVEQDALFVHDGRFHTSAGVSSGIDLALALVEADHGAALARDVARRLVVHLRRQGGQSQFSTALATPPARTSPIQRAIQAIESDPTAAHTLTTLAETAGISIRHLTRTFAAELGTTPTRILEDHRIELAQRLLLTGMTVTEVAARSGFGSAETLRRVFLARLGIGPSAYRRYFATSSPTSAQERPESRQALGAGAAGS